MPGFKKDFMTVPSLNGTQWARTGGLFGRNRAASSPTKAKQAPATTTNPYTTLPYSVSQPITQTMPYKQNPFNKAAYISGLASFSGAFVRTYLDNSNVVPNIQSLQTDNTGQKKAQDDDNLDNFLDAATEPQPLPHLQFLSDSLEPQDEDDNPIYNDVLEDYKENALDSFLPLNEHQQRLYELIKPSSTNKLVSVRSYLTGDRKLANYGQSSKYAQGTKDAINTYKGTSTYSLYKNSSDSERTYLLGKSSNDSEHTYSLHKNSNDRNNSLPVSVDASRQTGTYLRKNSGNVLPNSLLADRKTGTYLPGFHTKAAFFPTNAVNIRTLLSKLPRLRTLTSPSKATVGALGTSALLGGSYLASKLSPTRTYAPVTFPSSTVSPQVRTNAPVDTPFYHPSHSSIPAMDDVRIRDAYNQHMQEMGYKSSFVRNIPNVWGIKEAAYVPSKLIPVVAGLYGLLRGGTSAYKGNDANTYLREGAKGGIVGGSSALGANLAAHLVRTPLLRNLHGKAVTSRSLAFKYILPTILASSTGGLSANILSRQLVGDNPLKLASMQDWTKLHHVFTRPPTLPEVEQTAANVVGNKVNKTRKILSYAVPSAIGAGLTGLLAYKFRSPLLRTLKLASMYKIAPYATGPAVDLSDVHRKTRIDSKIPPKGDSTDMFKRAMRTYRDKLSKISANLGVPFPWRTYGNHSVPGPQIDFGIRNVPAGSQSKISTYASKIGSHMLAQGTELPGTYKIADIPITPEQMQQLESETLTQSYPDWNKPQNPQNQQPFFNPLGSLVEANKRHALSAYPQEKPQTSMDLPTGSSMLGGLPKDLSASTNPGASTDAMWAKSLGGNEQPPASPLANKNQVTLGKPRSPQPTYDAPAKVPGSTDYAAMKSRSLAGNKPPQPSQQSQNPQTSVELPTGSSALGGLPKDLLASTAPNASTDAMWAKSLGGGEQTPQTSNSPSNTAWGNVQGIGAPTKPQVPASNDYATMKSRSLTGNKQPQARPAWADAVQSAYDARNAPTSPSTASQQPAAPKTPNAPKKPPDMDIGAYASGGNMSPGIPFRPAAPKTPSPVANVPGSPGAAIVGAGGMSPKGPTATQAPQTAPAKAITPFEQARQQAEAQANSLRMPNAPIVMDEGRNSPIPAPKTTASAYDSAKPDSLSNWKPTPTGAAADAAAYGKQPLANASPPPSTPPQQSAPAGVPQRLYGEIQKSKDLSGNRQKYLERYLANSKYVDSGRRGDLQRELDSIRSGGPTADMSRLKQMQGNTAQDYSRQGFSPQAVAGWQGAPGSNISTQRFHEQNSANRLAQEQGKAQTPNTYAAATPIGGPASKMQPEAGVGRALAGGGVQPTNPSSIANQNSGRYSNLGPGDAGFESWAKQNPYSAHSLVKSRGYDAGTIAKYHPGGSIGGAGLAGGSNVPQLGAPGLGAPKPPQAGGMPAKLPQIPGKPQLAKLGGYKSAGFLDTVGRLGAKATPYLQSAGKATSRVWNHPLAQPLRGAMVGGTAGAGADQIAGLGGYDTGNTGLLAGAGAGALVRMPYLQSTLKGISPRLAKMHTQAGRFFRLPQPFDNAGIGGQAASAFGFGKGMRGKVQGGLIAGGMGAEAVQGMAEARGRTAAIRQADQIAQRLGYDNIEHFLHSAPAQGLAGYNREGVMGGISNFIRTLTQGHGGGGGSAAHTPRMPTPLGTGISQDAGQGFAHAFGGWAGNTAHKMQDMGNSFADSVRNRMGTAMGRNEFQAARGI